MRIVCDTNVLVSGILFGGTCRRIIRLVSEGRVEGFTSGALLSELEGVLLRRRFGLSQSQVEAILGLVRETFLLACPSERIEAVPGDPDDDRVLEAAVAADATHIVTGDRHLLDLGQFRATRIVTPADFLDGLESDAPPPRPEQPQTDSD